MGEITLSSISSIRKKCSTKYSLITACVVSYNTRSGEVANSGAVSNDLPTALPGTQFNVTRDGQNHPVTLQAKTFTQDFKSLPAGLYSASMTLTVE